MLSLRAMFGQLNRKKSLFIDEIFKESQFVGFYLSSSNHFHKPILDSYRFSFELFTKCAENSNNWFCVARTYDIQNLIPY